LVQADLPGAGGRGGLVSPINPEAIAVMAVKLGVVAEVEFEFFTGLTDGVG